MTDEAGVARAGAAPISNSNARAPTHEARCKTSVPLSCPTVSFCRTSPGQRNLCLLATAREIERLRELTRDGSRELSDCSTVLGPRPWSRARTGGMRLPPRSLFDVSTLEQT